MKKIEKPKLETKEYLDFIKVCRYLETKYGKEWDEAHDKLWNHWCNCGLNNGCFMTLYSEDFEDQLEGEDDNTEWHAPKEACNILAKEFADVLKVKGELEFWVCW